MAFDNLPQADYLRANRSLGAGKQGDLREERKELGYGDRRRRSWVGGPVTAFLLKEK